ncbi:MAG: long-chain fatty acid--CoA ligase [Rhodospirillaceae bacterium]|nr:long-chain fatty acid--CoA ligase [Rhodospirillaceae bacterium]
MIDYDSIRNLPAMFFDKARRRGDEACLASKPGAVWETLSWAAVAEQVSALSRGLRDHGVEPGDRVVIVSENRPEWAIADLAIMSAGAIAVPAYVTNTSDDHFHILSDSGAKLAVVSTKALADRLLPAVQRSPETNTVIAIDPAVTDAQGARVVSWTDALEAGRAMPNDVAERVDGINRKDMSCIIYTSGTGGTPKGAVLSHGAILCNCKGAYDLLREMEEFVEDGERFLSFLPLSHSYEHTAGLHFALSIGAEIYYAQSIDRLVGNMAETAPTIMAAVPRLYEAIHGRIVNGVQQAGGMKEKMFMKAVELGRKRYENPAALSYLDNVFDAALDKLVRAKVAERFGGRLKAFVSGGAPLNPEIGTFFLALGVRILQGYGQTESAPVISCNPVNGVRIHTVGPALTGVTVKIAEDGEILVQGELLMDGYWNNPDATAEVLVDGWLHTGDIGVVDADGYIQITDRKKDIIVNAGGDNISPQRVEGMLTIEPEIGQAMVFGDRRPHLVALLVADEDFAKSAGSEDELRSKLSEAVDRVNKKLNQIERIRRFTVADEAFTTDNEMMTPSMKIRRHVITAKYGEALEGLYGG